MDEREGGDDVDEATLASLHDALARVDGVPEQVRQAAIGAFAWRTIDADLAELTYDSLLDDRPLEGVRGDSGPRLVTFEGAELVIEVEVAELGRRRRLVGQLVPPTPARVLVHHAGATSSTEADDLGRFAVDGVHAGPVRISCERVTQGRRVDTGWVTL